MTTTDFKSGSLIVLCPLLTGLCYFFGDGLNGDFWYLVWLAPLSVLYLATFSPAGTTFIASFIAGFIGRLSWFSYLVRVATIVPTIFYFTLLSLFFAVMVLITRSVAIRSRPWYAVFVFPILYTAFEYLIFTFSPDGTALSVAYSQMNCLPLIQVASLTGILGITFIVNLIPSTLLFGWLLKRRVAGQCRPWLFSLIIICGVLLFGVFRMSQSSSGNNLKVGMAVMQEKDHNTSDRPDTAKDKRAADFYIKETDSLAGRGAQVVLFPERALSIDRHSETEMMNALSDAAIRNNICVIAAYTNLREEKERNSGIVINSKGQILMTYNKNYLVNGLERQFTPGRQTGSFRLDRLQTGVAICKDLDFQNYIRRYGKAGTSVLFIPAWDFVVDDWLHSRMAILRGVENGFSEVRAARTGSLTISDMFGKVTYEASSSDQKSVSLVGLVPTQHSATLYTSFGDWPGVMCLLLIVAVVGYRLFALRRLKVSGEMPR